MITIPQVIWNKMAELQEPRTWWARQMFKIKDEEIAQAIQEDVSATLKDIDNNLVTEFVETAESKGRLTLKGSRAPKAVL